MPITSQICIVVTSKWPPSIWCLSKRSRGEDTMDWLTDSHSFATQGFYSGFWMDCMWRTSPRPKDWSATSTPAGNLKSRKAWFLHPFTTNMEVSSAVLQPMTFRCPQTWLENPSDLSIIEFHDFCINLRSEEGCSGHVQLIPTSNSWGLTTCCPAATSAVTSTRTILWTTECGSPARHRTQSVIHCRSVYSIV